MAIKELQTRIALKYDSYENWTKAQAEDSTVGRNLVLLPGEIGICEIPAANNDSNVAPTVLFKVGDGSKKFHELPWASAKAADVYGWAKASDVVLDGKTIKFVGAKNADGTDKTIVLNYVTETEVKAITDPIAADVADLKAALGATGDVTTALSDLDARLDVIEGADTVDGSIAKAQKDAEAYAKDYTDVTVGNYQVGTDETATDYKAASGIRKEIAEAEARVKSYADGLDSAMDERVDTLEAASTDYNTRIGNNATAIENITKEGGAIATAVKAEEDARKEAIEDITKAETGKIAVAVKTEENARKEADKAITDAIGTSGDAKGTATVYGAIATVADAVSTLESGKVATNASEIARVEGLVTTEKGRAEGVEADFETRITAMEAFFEPKDAEGNDVEIKAALDTLVEIQKYITDDGEAAGLLVERVGAAETAINNLKGIVEDGGTLEVRVDQAEADIAENTGNISANAGNIATLQDIVAGYSTKSSIKTAIEAADAKGQQGINDAATAQAAAEAAQSAADAAQGEVDALEEVVAGVKETADNAASGLADLIAELTGDAGRVTAAEGEISTIKALVNDATKGNEKLRTDVNALQTLTGDSAKGNEALYTELTRVAGLVDDEETGLAATKAIADGAAAQAADNKADIAEIKSNYVKTADFLGDSYIFNCGSSTTIVHVAPSEN